MTKLFFKPLALGATVAFALPASAEVSALDVWESWKSYAELSGQTITVGSQETINNALVLRNVGMSVETPEGSVASTMELLEFRERGDGTVAVTMSPDLPISISIDPPEGEAVDMAMILRQRGMSIVASGDPDNISFDYIASNIDFSVDKLVVDGEEIDAMVDIALQDINGDYTVQKGALNSYSSDLSAAMLSYAVRFTNPEEDNSMLEAAGSMQNLAASSRATLPDGLDMADPSAMFKGGVELVGSFSTGGSNGEVTILDKSDNISITTSSDSNKLDFSILNGAISYGAGATGINYSISGAKIPFPQVDIKLAEVALKFLMPMVRSEEPNDYGMLVRVSGLEISDMIWQMFDPASVMPRDPATISLDVSGTMNWLIDITDPEAAENFDGENPALLHSLTINDIELSAVGAEITGAGDFTFDNSDMTTFKGMPAPTGAIDLRLVGLNGLLDRLIQMGFLPDDQAMGMRMMLGLFARPAGGEDTMTSTIEVTGDGSVFANGQQLK